MCKSRETLEKRIREETAEREASVLAMLFDLSRDPDAADMVHTQEDYAALYAQLEGMSLEKMDSILYLVTMLCRDHEKGGFDRGFKLGMKLKGEIG